MRKLLALYRDERGAAVIEMAIALPVLVTFIWGLLQIGLAFQASAGMQHGLGEGARFATLCFNPDPDTGCETPTDAQIRTKVGEKVFGTGNGTLAPLEIADTTTTTGTTTTVVYKTLTLNYSQPTNFLFFPGPTISLSRSKRVYLAG
jgi:Flp pilus assembly protein TadG